MRPAAFFCAVVPPCEELLFELEECDALPPRLDAPEEFAIFAARSFDIPLSFNASYCFSFFTFELLFGIDSSWSLRGLIRAGIVLGVGVLRRFGIGNRRLVELLVPVVLARVRILVVHERRASRQLEA